MTRSRSHWVTVTVLLIWLHSVGQHAATATQAARAAAAAAAAAPLGLKNFSDSDSTPRKCLDGDDWLGGSLPERPLGTKSDSDSPWLISDDEWAAIQTAREQPETAAIAHIEQLMSVSLRCPTETSSNSSSTTSTGSTASASSANSSNGDAAIASSVRGSSWELDPQTSIIQSSPVANANGSSQTSSRNCGPVAGAGGTSAGTTYELRNTCILPRRAGGLTMFPDVGSVGGVEPGVLPLRFECGCNRYPVNQVPPSLLGGCRDGMSYSLDPCVVSSLAASEPSPSPPPTPSQASVMNASSLHLWLDGPIAVVWPVFVHNPWHFLLHLIGLSHSLEHIKALHPNSEVHLFPTEHLKYERYALIFGLPLVRSLVTNASGGNCSKTQSLTNRHRRRLLLSNHLQGSRSYLRDLPRQQMKAGRKGRVLVDAQSEVAASWHHRAYPGFEAQRYSSVGFQWWRMLPAGFPAGMRVTQVNHLELSPHQFLTPNRSSSLLSLTQQLYSSLTHSPPPPQDSHHLRHLASSLGLCYKWAYMGFPLVLTPIPTHNFTRLMPMERIRSVVDRILNMAGVDQTMHRPWCNSKDNSSTSGTRTSNRQLAPILGLIVRRHTRRLCNLPEIVEVAASVGFRVRLLAFEKLSAMQQVQASASVDVLAGMHGAGMTNVIWLRPGSQVIEIYPSNPEDIPVRPGTDVNPFSYYGSWAALANATHHVLVGPYERGASERWDRHVGRPMGKDEWRRLDSNVPRYMLEAIMKETWDRLHAC